MRYTYLVIIISYSWIEVFYVSHPSLPQILKRCGGSVSMIICDSPFLIIIRFRSCTGFVLWLEISKTKTLQPKTYCVFFYRSFSVHINPSSYFCSFIMQGPNNNFIFYYILYALVTTLQQVYRNVSYISYILNSFGLYQFFGYIFNKGLKWAVPRHHLTKYILLRVMNINVKHCQIIRKTQSNFALFLCNVFDVQMKISITQHLTNNLR